MQVGIALHFLQPSCSIAMLLVLRLHCETQILTMSIAAVVGSHLFCIPHGFIMLTVNGKDACVTAAL